MYSGQYLLSFVLFFPDVHITILVQGQKYISLIQSRIAVADLCQRMLQIIIDLSYFWIVNTIILFIWNKTKLVSVGGCIFLYYFMYYIIIIGVKL